MNEITNKNASLALIKNKQFYGVVVTPDGQRFRFDLAEIIEKLSEEDFERIIRHANTNYEHGKTQYERALAEEPAKGEYYEVFEKSRQDFLGYWKDSHESGQSSAKFYLASEICQKTLEELEVKIYSEESKEEWQEAGCSIKFSKPEQERQNQEKLRLARDEGYREGYEQCQKEEQNKRKDRQTHKKKSFWNRFFE